MRTTPAGEIIEALSGAGQAEAAGEVERPAKGDWAAWFPVIDRGRCTDCQQCLQFCLFGVYDLSDDGRVEVAQPANCKTNCPACARVCPATAIIFPKYHTSPINGDEVSAEGAEPVAVDLGALGGGDLRAALRNRGKRFAIDDDDGRADHLAKLRERLDIPPDVLRDVMASGSPDCPCDCKCKLDGSEEK